MELSPFLVIYILFYLFSVNVYKNCVCPILNPSLKNSDRKIFYLKSSSCHHLVLLHQQHNTGKSIFFNPPPTPPPPPSFLLPLPILMFLPTPPPSSPLLSTPQLSPILPTPLTPPLRGLVKPQMNRYDVKNKYPLKFNKFTWNILFFKPLHLLTLKGEIHVTPDSMNYWLLRNI